MINFVEISRGSVLVGNDSSKPEVSHWAATFLASQDALEVMLVSQSVSKGTDRDFTDVTLVSEDTY